MSRLLKATLRLEHMLEDVNWEAITSSRSIAGKMPDDDVRVAFLSKNKESPDVVNTIEIRFGKEVIQEMGWQHKDKIVVYFDKKDSLKFMLCKTVGGNGYRIHQQAGLTTFCLKFRWKDKLKLAKKPMTSVDYYIKNNQMVIFNAEVEK